jgi:LemA protein
VTGLLIGSVVLLAVAVAGTLLGVALVYNRLVTTRNRYANAYAQIDVQLKRRHDLIPNLVETVRQYMQHERGLLEAVTAARAQATAAAQAAVAQPGDGAALHTLAAAEAALTGTLGRLALTVENYPDLKANSTVLRLMEELASTENRVGFARQAYNDAVMVHNTACESFPAVVLARPLGFRPAAFFELPDAAERAVPQVGTL